MQLRLAAAELERLNNRIADDYRRALSDHDRRMERWRRYYQLWRNRVDPPAAGDEDASNIRVPLVQWQVYQELANEITSLLGDDAQIIAKPTAASDQKIVHKVGLYETWRLFQSMRITNPLTVFTFRKILFGRAFAYAPWVRDTYPVLADDGAVKEEVWYEGPGFYPIWPDDLIVPAEDAETIHDFSFVIRRYRATPEELLRGDGTLYQGIRENFQKIVSTAMTHRQREWQGEEIKKEKDEAEGVLYEGALSSSNALVVHEWCGRWRMLKGRGKDASEDDLSKRQLFESELVVRRLPSLNLVIGVQDLLQLYPKQRHRRPIVEASMVKDGSYWPAGFGELLESIEDEVSANHNLFTDAGQFAVGPLIFAKPGAGLNEEKFRYEPNTVLWTEDPAGVKVVNMQADLQYAVAKEQTTLAYAERVTGVSDLALGRQSDRPNAPRTASGTIALLEKGNVRASLNLLTLREDLSIIVARNWELDSQFAPESVFFRVTEEDAQGLFDVRGGGAEMTAKERGGRYDFDVKFATSVWSREAEKQTALQLYQLDLGNPLIVNNPRALWVLTNKLHSKFGDDNFADLIPEPADLGQPKNPREEWTLCLQGEEPHVNPMDNDDLHLIDHYRRLNEAKMDPERDEAAMRLMVAHVIEHQGQKRQKMLMQTLTAQLAQSLATNNAETGGLVMGGVPASLQNVQETIGGLYSGRPGATAGPPGPNG